MARRMQRMERLDELIGIEARLRKAGEHETADIAKRLMKFVK